MKICSDTPAYHYIDTAPLAARYEVICASIIAFIAAGRHRDMLRYSHKIVRLVRVFTKLETQNILLKRKLDMLSHRPWRDCVLRELGGLRKLKFWEAAKARIEERLSRPPKTAPKHEPLWLYAPERIAESERLKARARMCRRATAHPLIFRDRCKMDFEGEFRLAPLPRGPRSTRQIKVYTKNTIVDYDWNPIPFAKELGFGPAIVWPAEFRAAMKIETEILDARATPSTVIPAQEQSDAEPEPIPNYRSQALGPGSVDCSFARGDKRGNTVPTLSLKDVLSRKVYYDLIGSLTT